jgi:hypothetical protein
MDEPTQDEQFSGRERIIPPTLGEIVVEVPELHQVITFGPNLYGRGNQPNVMAQVSQAGLSRPTTTQVLCLFDFALRHPNHKHCQYILKKAGRGEFSYLFTATEDLTNSEGLYVFDNIDGTMPQTSAELETLRQAKDLRIRFVPRGFKSRVMPIGDFLKHPVTQAHIEEPALPIAERVARRLHKDSAYVGALDHSDSDTLRYMALDSGWGYDRLSLKGEGSQKGNGFAAGVVRSQKI